MTRLRAHRRSMVAIAALAAFMAPAGATEFVWSNRSFTATAGMPNPMDPPDTLTVASGGAKSFIALTWTNNSVAAHQADTIFGGSAALINGGLWDLQADGASFSYDVGSRPVFAHIGTLRKSAGTLTHFGSWAFVSNGGAVNWGGGVLTRSRRRRIRAGSTTPATGRSSSTTARSMCAAAAFGCPPASRMRAS